MKVVSTFFLVSVMFWGVIGDSQETEVCPLFEHDYKVRGCDPNHGFSGQSPGQRKSAVQACAWIPSCVLPECNTQCVANVLGQNQILHNLEPLYATAMLCTAVSASVKAAAMRTDGRRLQVLFDGVFHY